MIVVGIEYLYQILGQIFLFHRLLVISLVESLKAEGVERLCVPDTQSVYHVVAVAHNRHVVGDGHNGAVSLLHKMVSAVFPDRLYIAAEFNLCGVLCPAKLKGIAVLQPLVRHLQLVTVFNLLFEHAVVVADAAAVGRITQSRQGIQKAGGEPSEAPVSKCRIRLLILNGI